MYMSFSYLYDLRANIYLHDIHMFYGISSELCKILVLSLSINPPRGHLPSGCAGSEGS